MKKLSILSLVSCVLFSVFIAGCNEQQKTSTKNAPVKPTLKATPKKSCNCPDSNGLSTVDGLIRYVSPLPAVHGARRWQNSYSDGLVIETAHYRIYTTMLEPLMLRQIPAFVEAAWREYQGQLPVPVGGGDRFTVYIFRDRQQWESYTRSFTGGQAEIYLKIKKGAYYLNGQCVAYNIGRTRTFSILGHEGWHQFCDKYFKYRLPSWLDEGIAQLFEYSDFENGQFIFNSAKNYQRLGALKLSIQEKNIIPLKDLILLNPGEVVSLQQADKAVMAFYAQSYALVRFLKEEGYGKRLTCYQKMLLGALNGAWPLDATETAIASNKSSPPTVEWNRHIAQKLFDVYIGEDIERLSPEYYRFCKKIVYYIRVK
ncbi:MAG: hypothetical protein WC770_00675 [Phycisphaerae bacterium]|jgi:hypothetical protein